MILTELGVLLHLPPSPGLTAATVVAVVWAVVAGMAQLILLWPRFTRTWHDLQAAADTAKHRRDEQRRRHDPDFG